MIHVCQFDYIMNRKRLKYTDEQHAVVHSSDRIKIVEAYAGSGKSSLLRYEAQQHKDERILYLVYGRKAREDAEELFSDCEHVDVRTVHAHAYRQERYKWKASPTAGSVASFLGAFDHGECASYQHELSAIVSQFIAYYLNVAERRISAAFRAFTRLNTSSEKTELCEVFDKEICHVARCQLSIWVSGKEQCPHDFYVKHSAASGSFLKGLHEYDRVLVDEGQDLSPIMSESLQKYTGHLVVVGDSHQSIYGFRYAVNALQAFPQGSRFTLSKSFRFGSSIAQFVTQYMQAIVDDSFIVRGANRDHGRIRYSSYVRQNTYPLTHVYLARTNLELVVKAADCLKNKTRFSFEKDVYYILDKLGDLWHLYNKRQSQIKDPLLASFKDFDELREYAGRIEDLILLSLTGVISRYRKEMPDMIYDLREASRRKYQKGELLLSTVHAAKGKEYGVVHIADDIFRNLEKSLNQGTAGEEGRVCYVSLTRAENEVILPGKYRDQLWELWLSEILQEGRIEFWSG